MGSLAAQGHVIHCCSCIEILLVSVHPPDTVASTAPIYSEWISVSALSAVGWLSLRHWTMLYHLEGVRAMDRRPNARPMQSHAQPALDCIEPYAAANCCMSKRGFLMLYASIALEYETPIVTKCLSLTQHWQMTHDLSGTQEHVGYGKACKGLISDQFPSNGYICSSVWQVVKKATLKTLRNSPKVSWDETISSLGQWTHPHLQRSWCMHTWSVLTKTYLFSTRQSRMGMGRRRPAASDTTAMRTRNRRLEMPVDAEMGLSQSRAADDHVTTITWPDGLALSQWRAGA